MFLKIMSVLTWIVTFMIGLALLQTMVTVEITPKENTSVVHVYAIMAMCVFSIFFQLFTTKSIFAKEEE